MGKPVFILHFQPIELYPPIMNLLRYFEINYPNAAIRVLTTKCYVDTVSPFRSQSNKLILSRYGGFNIQMNRFRRAFNYLFYYFRCTLFLFIHRPDIIFYYETLSSYPVYLYLKYFNRKAKVLIHYHEYSSSIDLLNGMRIVRYFHKREAYLYNKALWISHTNEERLRMFIKDEKLAFDEKFKIFPNYPPISWQNMPIDTSPRRIKIIYVGALSIDTMFTKEFISWIEENEIISLDIFSNNVSAEAMNYLKFRNAKNVNLFDGVDYYSLPDILKNYHVGLVLYNGHIPNYVFNAPNKLFEYLISGLDIWFPKVMTGSMQYVTYGVFPKVISIDFQNLSKININQLIDKSDLLYRPSPYYCENIFPEICKYLFPD